MAPWSSESVVLLAAALAPRDLNLPLPLDETLLKVLLIALFLLHIVFVNLMVGGSLLASIYEWAGRRDSKYDLLAERVAETVTVNKSMAVVLGVGPLLVISLLYTLQFYTANSLTGHAWILIVPLTTVAFLTTYLHKYTWSTWNSGRLKFVHRATGAVSAVLFLTIPWIFLANVNLMQFPDRWVDVQGFLSTLKIGNGAVFTRYLHFLGASVAVTALFLSLWTTRSEAIVASLPAGFTKGGLRRHFYRIAFWVTACQFVVGPTTLLILPHVGMNLFVVSAFLVGALIGVILLGLLWTEITSSDQRIGRLWVPIVLVFQLLASSMALGRQLYRDQALGGHLEQSRARTDAFETLVELANRRRQSGLSLEPDGRELFTSVCGACHFVDKAVPGPSSRELVTLYRGKPDEIVAWARKPAKKRQNYPQMPAMAHLGEKRLRKIAEFLAGLDPANLSALSMPVDPSAIQFQDPDKVIGMVLSRQGDAKRGKELFATRTCNTCHIPQDDMSARKAPDLSGSSKSKTRQFVLESILNPSASLSKGFEPWMFLTVDEEVITGTIVEESPESVSIRLNDGTVRKLAVEEIDSRKQGDLSPMPKGLIDALTPQQAADLVEYIFSL